MNVAAWKAVLGDRVGTDRVTPYDSAARATDLSGLPPTFIEVGALEIFRDECIEYARQLLLHDVATELHVYSGCFHGFHLFAPNARITKLALAARNSSLARAWYGPDKVVSAV